DVFFRTVGAILPGNGSGANPAAIHPGTDLGGGSSRIDLKREPLIGDLRGSPLPNPMGGAYCPGKSGDTRSDGERPRTAAVGENRVPTRRYLPRRGVEREAPGMGEDTEEDTLAKTKAAGGSKRNQSAAKGRARSAVRLRDSDWYA